MNCPQCGLWLPLARNAPLADNQLENDLKQAMLGGFCSMECREACYQELTEIFYAEYFAIPKSGVIKKSRGGT